jgi:hypothetical protein
MGFPAKNRLPIRHYPNRSFAQMRRRAALRNAMMAEESTVKVLDGNIVSHWTKKWDEFFYDVGDPAVRLWKKGTPFNPPLTKMPVSENSLLKVIPAHVLGTLYNKGASLRDHFRKPKIFSSRLRPIPEDAQSRIACSLKEGL